MSGFLRREASSGLSHSQELTWNSQSHSGTTGWATPTSRAEFTGAGRENQLGFMTSPNDLFQSSGRNTHLDLRIRELESRGQQLECAYNKEHEENVGLRAEVKVLRTNFDQLLDAVRNSRIDGPQSTANLSSTAPPAFSDPLVRNCLTATLPTPNRNDYPNIKFWTRSQWTETNSRFKSETKFDVDPTGSDTKPRKRNNYIETADGDLLNEEDMAKIRLTMRGAFQQLRRLELAPDTWTKICHLGRKLYLLTVCGVHPELTYCDSFWKAEQIAIDHFPSWYNNHIRIKKPDIKKEQVDSKCPLPKRGNPTPTDGIPSKKARTESNIQSESQDDNTDESIYYDPPASPTATTKANLGNDALVINNPLSTLFSTPQPPLVSPPAANNHQSSTTSTSAEPEPALLAAIAESHPIAPPVRQSTLTIPSFATADFISSTNNVNKVQEDTGPGPVVVPSHAPDDRLTSPSPSSQQVPMPASRSRKARRATVGKVDNPKNRCKSAWLEKHPDGNEEQFKAYWNTVKGT